LSGRATRCVRGFGLGLVTQLLFLQDFRDVFLTTFGQTGPKGIPDGIFKGSEINFLKLLDGIWKGMWLGWGSVNVMDGWQKLRSLYTQDPRDFVCYWKKLGLPGPAFGRAHTCRIFTWSPWFLSFCF